MKTRSARSISSCSRSSRCSGREAELRQLVHAVIDDRARVEMPREGQHHRRVVPGDQRARLSDDVRVEQTAQGVFALDLVQASRKVRRDQRAHSGNPPPGGLSGRRSRAAPSSIGSSQKMTVISVAKRLIRCCGRWNTKSHRRCEKQSKVGRAASGAEWLGGRLYWNPDACQHFAFILQLLGT